MEEQPATPSGLRGAHIALVGNHCAVQLGVLSTAEGSQRLAQAMLEAEEELPEEDVADAMGEIANILVGVMKGAMIHLDEGLKLGLPGLRGRPPRAHREHAELHAPFPARRRTAHHRRERGRPGRAKAA